MVVAILGLTISSFRRFASSMLSSTVTTIQPSNHININTNLPVLPNALINPPNEVITQVINRIHKYLVDSGLTGSVASIFRSFLGCGQRR